VLFDSTRKAGIEGDKFTIVNLLRSCKRLGLGAYTKCSLMEQALKLFDKMERRDVISWSTMIAGYAHCGKPDEVIAFFQQMRLAETTRNSITVLTHLQACTISAELKLSNTAHGLVIRNY